MNNLFKLSVLSLALTLAACGSDNDDKDVNTEDTKTDTQQTTDTDTNTDTDSGTDADVEQGAIYGPLFTGERDAPKKVYFDLDTNTVVELTDEEAATNRVWDIAFERYKLHLNGNHADNPVAIYNLNNNADFYDADGKVVAETITAATTDSELQEYLDVTAADVPSDASVFIADVSEKTIDGWYNYDMSSHKVTAAATNYFVTKNGDVFSKFSITNLVLDGHNVTDITLGYYNDLPAADSDTVADEVATDMASLELNMANECSDDATQVYVDFVTGSTVASDAAHDLTITCDNNIMTMSLDLPEGVTAMQDFENKVNSVEFAGIYEGYGYFTPNYLNVSGYSEVAKGSFGSTFVYGAQGGHTLWSDYNVYIIKSGDKHFKLQFTSYYDDEGKSGNISFRADELVAAE